MSTQKIATTKPLLILLYGFPGAGKTHFASQLAETLQVAHIQSDRIRYELFEQPAHDRQEDEIVNHLMNYMAEEFLKAGFSVIYDVNAGRLSQRMALRDMARKFKATPLLIWLQIDHDTAFGRTQARDHRKSDDKYAVNYDQAAYEKSVGYMQHPQNEDYIVISGKHTFNTQRSAVVKKLYELGLIDPGSVQNRIIKPGMVNLIPQALRGRVDESRRNIVIR